MLKWALRNNKADKKDNRITYRLLLHHFICPIGVKPMVVLQSRIGFNKLREMSNEIGFIAAVHEIKILYQPAINNQYPPSTMINHDSQLIASMDGY